jgi:hypothetical protein
MLPKKFAELLKGHEPRELKLREADDPSSSPWDMDVLFDAAGCIFLGRGWEQFAQYYCLQRGSFLLFSFDGDALLTVKVFKLDMCRRHYCYDHDASTSNDTGPDPRTDEESTDEESTDEESMDEDDPFESSIIVSQRVDLDDHEKDHIRELLPPKDEYIGVPYVTRLTRTNLARYEMVRMVLMLFLFFYIICAYNVCMCMTYFFLSFIHTFTIQKLPHSVADSAGIPSSGHAGLRLGASETFTTVPYNTDSDGRITFGRNAWRKFLEGKHLKEMQALLITLRSTRNRHLDVKIVMQTVSPWV